MADQPYWLSQPFACLEGRRCDAGSLFRAMNAYLQSDIFVVRLSVSVSSLNGPAELQHTCKRMQGPKWTSDSHLFARARTVRLSGECLAAVQPRQIFGMCTCNQIRSTHSTNGSKGLAHRWIFRMWILLVSCVQLRFSMHPRRSESQC